jgi:hypothetical protein
MCGLRARQVIRVSSHCRRLIHLWEDIEMNRIIPGSLCALLPAGTSISAVHAADFTFAGIGKQVKYGQGVGSGPTASGGNR